MAEKGSAITPTGEQHRLARRTSSEWGQNPFAALQRLADDVDRMFNDFALRRGKGGAPLWSGTESGMWAPEIEVFQRADQLVIKADLPGLSKEDLSIEVTDDAVTIEGERKTERKDEREGYYRTERSYGTFCRVIPLPDGAITGDAKANFRDGVLEITMPAPPASKGRRLEIGDGSKK